MLQRRKPTDVPKGANPESSSIEYENLDLGDHEVRLAFVADLGLQHKEYKGESKGNHQQIALGLEFVGKTFKKDGEEYPVMLWTKPFYVYSTLTEKGLELQYALAFNSAAVEGVEFDWEAELGKPANAVITHTKGKGENADKKYDNIARLTPIPEKYQANVPEMTIASATGNGKDVTDHLYGLAKFVYDKQVYEQEAVQGAKTEQQTQDAFDDDIPF